MRTLKNDVETQNLLSLLSNDLYDLEPVAERRGSVLPALLQCAGIGALFIYSGPLIRLMDPTAGVLDAGILSIFLLALFVVDAFAVAAWLLLRLIRDLFTLNEIPCLETKILVGSFFGLLSLFVGVFVVLL